MVALVDDLEQLGLVRRERNPADRRAYMIRLTSEGADLQRRAEEALNGEAEKFFRPLSENEGASRPARAPCRALPRRLKPRVS